MEFRALIVDDEETYARSLKRLLLRRGVTADHAGTCADGLARARRRGYDFVLLDFLLPDGSGLDLIPPLRALAPPPQVIMMTAFGTIENAVEAMRRGAFDYVTKSTTIDGIVERVLDARRVAEARAKAPRPAARSGEPAAGGGLLGESPAIREARLRIGEVARSATTTVLLSGESGTGKGVAARAIHLAGARGGEPFVAIDCVALPATLAESELFGHEKGAFTGADRMKPGKLEQCGRGTVLLDEIGDMDLGLQGKLLRVIEERTFERVGGVKSIELGARIIAASHRDLAAWVEERRFRLDLYHRLSVFPIALPPLRARGDDVALLADHFVREFASRLGKPLEPLGREVTDVLCGYDFPGNVRELKNVIERAAILAPSRTISVDLLPPRLRDGPRAGATISLGTSPPLSPGGSPAAAVPRLLAGPGGRGLTVEFRPGTDTLDGIEKRLLEEALRLADGKKSRAAELLGISRFALLRRVEKYGL